MKHQKGLYQLAVEGGFDGTFEEWILSLRGEQGQPGENVELSVQDGFVVWKNVGDSEWKILVSLELLVGSSGTNGREVTFRVYNGFIQWNYKGETEWINLVALATLADLQGNTGKSAYQIYKEHYPNYNKTEAEWVNDLINGSLSNNSQTLIVNFISDGEIIESKAVKFGNRVELPLPRKEGHDFQGWFSGFTVNDGQFLNHIPITTNLDLYANWSKNSYTLYYETNGAGVIEPKTYAYMDSIVFPEELKRPGYIFYGWFKDINLLQQFTTKRMPGDNTILYAKWVKDDVIDLGGYTIKIAQSKHLLGDIDPFHVDYKALDKYSKQQAFEYIEDKYNCSIDVVPYPDYAEWGNPRWQYIEMLYLFEASQYDFYIVPDSQIAGFASNGILRDFSSWYAEYGNGFMDRTYYISGSYRGGLYSLTDGKAGISNVMYYNIGLLEQLNMEKTPAQIFNEGNWTYSTFKEYVLQAQQKLTALSTSKKYYAVAGNSPYYWIGMSNAGGVNLVDTAKFQLNIKHPNALEAADTLKAISLDGAMDPAKQIDAGVVSWMEGRSLFSTGDLWFVNASNRWPENLWGEGEKTRYGYVPFPRPDNTIKNDQKIGLSGNGSTMVMLKYKDYSGYGPDCNSENIYRAMLEMFMKARAYQVNDPIYDEENQYRLYAQRFTDSEDSVDAMVWMLSRINQLGFYDPLGSPDNPIINTGSSAFSTSIHQYINGSISSFSNAVDPYISTIKQKMIEVFS